MHKKILEFIANLEVENSEKSEIVKDLFKQFKEHKVINERFIYGGIGMYINDNLIGGIYSSKNHISLIFSRGNELVDKYNVLEGSGKLRRYIKLMNKKDIIDKQCNFYIDHVISLEE